MVCIEKGLRAKRIGPTAKSVARGGDSRKGRLTHQNQRKRGRVVPRWRGLGPVVTVRADEGGVIDW